MSTTMSVSAATMPWPPAGAGRARWAPLVAVCLAQLLLMLDVTIVIVALPDVGRQVHGDLQAMQWVVDIYALALATALINAGVVADRFGRKKLFVAGLVVFGISSAACAAASSPAVLIAGRGLQGVGGAMLFATGLAILGAAYRGPDRAVALGAFGAVFGAAVALGPLVGGAILEVASWRWIFLVNLPVVAVAVVVAVRSLPETKDPQPRRVDLPGQVTFSLGVAAMIGAFIKAGDWGWGSARIVGLFVLAALALVSFVIVERRARAPMFDLSLLRNRPFAAAGVAAFATSASLFGMFVYLTVWFNQVQHVSGLGAGLRLLPVTIVAFVAAAVAGRASSRLSSGAVMIAALAAITVGLLQMTTLDATSSWTVALPGLVLCGLGFGLVNPTVAAVTLATVPERSSATATGMNSTFRQIGVASGVAVLGAIFQHGTAAASPMGYARALDHVFVAAAAIAGAGVIVVMLLLWRVRADGDEREGAHGSVSSTVATATAGKDRA